MSDLFHRLLGAPRAGAPPLRPRLASRFAPPDAAGGAETGLAVGGADASALAPAEPASAGPLDVAGFDVAQRPRSRGGASTPHVAREPVVRKDATAGAEQVVATEQPAAFALRDPLPTRSRQRPRGYAPPEQPARSPAHELTPAPRDVKRSPGGSAASTSAHGRHEAPRAPRAPADPDEPTRLAGPTKLAEPAELTELADPTELAELAEAAVRTELAERTDAAKLAELAEAAVRTELAERTEAARLAEPTEPAGWDRAATTLDRPSEAAAPASSAAGPPSRWPARGDVERRELDGAPRQAHVVRDRHAELSDELPPPRPDVSRTGKPGSALVRPAVAAVADRATLRMDAAEVPVSTRTRAASLPPLVRRELTADHDAVAAPAVHRASAAAGEPRRPTSLAASRNAELDDRSPAEHVAGRGEAIAREDAQPAAAEPPVVRISIGRIDVRVAQPAAAAPRPSVPRPTVGMSLESYLQHREGRSR